MFRAGCLVLKEIKKIELISPGLSPYPYLCIGVYWF